MKLTRVAVVLLLGVSLVLGLNACSSTRKPSADSGQDSAVSSDDSSAQTYGVGGGPGYHGEIRKNEYGEIINPLVAPAEQTYYFAFDQSTIRSQDIQAIKIQADYLATHKSAKVRLEGNADERGSREYNIGLGWRRDQSVARLLEEQGVSPQQIEMVSYGKEHPAVLGSNEEAWRLNRRVHLVYEAY
ncbi:MAG: peptidoglycan-associated lipoprotein [Coxiella sp. RIFCSPHIGHO2_12_FULL_44_14]|nr:MAG: peptidoglycan-associated lipoprotein [Coxiella sp. RIFCSPHIGHO2_12_FULL_44_14]